MKKSSKLILSWTTSKKVKQFINDKKRFKILAGRLLHADDI